MYLFFSFSSLVPSSTDKIALATGGMRADYTTLHKLMLYEIDMYKYKNRKEISISACAQLLSNLLYSRRRFPIYAFCLLGGIDERGESVLYSFDAIGTCGTVRTGAAGSGEKILDPILDSLILRHHRQRLPPAAAADAPAEDDAWSPPVEKAVQIAHQALVAAAERDIHTGDYAEIFVITPTGITKDIKPLKFD
jgi:20S proteasome subunit beta 6